MNHKQRGFSLHEIIGALAISAIMVVGVSAMVDTSMEDTKAQQAALYQTQVATAAAKYINANYAAVTSSVTASPPAKITLDMLRTTGYLSTNFQNTNVYGHTPCVLVLQPTANKLDALVVTEGTTQIPARILPFAAANAGKGGGYIPATTPPPLVAQGAFNAWSLNAASLANFLTKNCSGTAAGAGSLASAIFFDGPGDTDFLYRSAVQGKQDLNTLKTPMLIKTAILPVEHLSDTNCDPSNAATFGGISATSLGEVLSCQSGFWKRQGTKSWRDPVADYATLTALPATGASANQVGDVRMVTGLSRAFTWDGTSWKALGVDQNGRLTTDDIQLNKVVTKGGTCSPDGVVARDTNGLVMSCQSGKWGSQSTMELGNNYTGCKQIRPSKYAVSEPTCPTKFTPAEKAGITFDAGSDTWTAPVPVPTVTVTKNGLISASVYAQMNRGLVSNPGGANGQLSLIVSIMDNDTGIILGSNQAQSTALHNDSAGINVAISKAVPKNTNGYSVVITTLYSLFDDGADKLYNESNYTANGKTVQQTPLMTGWNIDIFY